MRFYSQPQLDLIGSTGGSLPATPAATMSCPAAQGADLLAQSINFDAANNIMILAQNTQGRAPWYWRFSAVEAGDLNACTLITSTDVHAQPGAWTDQDGVPGGAGWTADELEGFHLVDVDATDQYRQAFVVTSGWGNNFYTVGTWVERRTGGNESARSSPPVFRVRRH